MLIISNLYKIAELNADETERGDGFQQLRAGQHAVSQAGLEEVVVALQDLIHVVHLEKISHAIY